MQAVKSLPAKLILFAYGLLILIIVALYTASAAAQLTAQSLRSDIRSLDDLRGEVGERLRSCMLMATC